MDRARKGLEAHPGILGGRRRRVVGDGDGDRLHGGRGGGGGGGRLLFLAREPSHNFTLLPIIPCVRSKGGMVGAKEILMVSQLMLHASSLYL